mgnify:CR=1 FL=1
MTLQELQIQLIQCRSLAECDQFLRANLHEIRPLFYGLTQRELLDGRRLDYEDVFDAFASSDAGNDIRKGYELPASVVALLIFFLSLFERAHLYQDVRTVAELIPMGPLRQQGEALFEYKNIDNAATNYIHRFGRILTLLQEAWNHSNDSGRRLSENLLQEYILDAFLEPKIAGIDIRHSITSHFLDPSLQQRYPILIIPVIQKLLDTDANKLVKMRKAVRSHIMEDFHAQACALAPDLLLMTVANEFVGETELPNQTHTRIPEFLSDQLDQMNAEYNPQRQGAKHNYAADDAQNRIYLGTYFPRTVVESWNIFTELLSIPVIQAAFRQKDVIRLLDIGSGTGAAVVGMLLALNEWSQCEAAMEITSIDFNEDALGKQGEILESFRDRLSFHFDLKLRHVQLPFDLEGFAPAFSAILDQESYSYDLIICWKSLCEFYNFEFAPAQGIIRNMLGIASHKLVPYGLCVVADVTTTDNGAEHFAITLNREANEHDTTPNAKTHTILPLCCGSRTKACDPRCYTQRCFRVSHRLAHNDQTKIAYRVLAPEAFAYSITASFADHAAYRVNAARPNEACGNGRKRQAGGAPCGYTGFFTKGE